MRYVKRLILRYLDKFEHKKIKTRIDFIALLNNYISKQHGLVAWDQLQNAKKITVKC